MAILRKLRSGMIYPAVVMTLGVGVVITMSFTLVPAMVKLYGSLGADLPTPTIILMKLSKLMLKQPYLALVPFGALTLFFRNFKKLTSIPSVQRGMVKLPVLGKIIRKASATVAFRDTFDAGRGECTADDGAPDHI